MGYSLYKYFEKTEIRDKRQEARELDSDDISTSIRHCEALKEPWQFISKKTNNIEIKVFKPSLFNPFLKGYCKSLKEYVSFLYWLIISYFDLTIYYVKDGEKLIHTSFVTGKNFKFPFMGENDLHIGPCVTNEEYRGKGIYPKVLQKIALDFPQKTLYMIIEDSNIASIKGVTKAGFKKFGKICKYKNLFSNRYTLESDEWKYYNHAVIPNTAPHIIPDLTLIKNGSIWNIDNKFPLFARWTSDYDCKEKTDWYYVIKDTKYEIQSLNSNRRKKITRGRKNFYTKIIKAKDYKSEMADICEEAFSSYPIEYRPDFSKINYIKSIENGEWDNFIIIGVFYNTTNELVGYLTLLEHDSYIEAQQHKVKPSFEKYYVNYALVDGMLTHFNDKIVNKKKYIVNGNTNLVHHTAFYDLLIDHFGYRKAYCKLNIAYRPILRPFVFFLYLFRRTINRLKNKSALLYKINAVLEMEKIVRKCRGMK